MNAYDAHPQSPASGARARRTTGPVTRLLDTVGSIWFGVALLILIFLYSSIGSAVPLIRQGALADWIGLEFLRFEKSEMEWFSWWPFQAMIGMFCISLILVTLRRIPLTRVNAGVWMIHTGIVMLAVSSAFYFGMKVEGDAVIFQSVARIMAPGMRAPASMVVRPGASTHVDAGGVHYEIGVQQILPDYSMRTEGLADKKTAAVWLSVSSTAEPRQFTRVLLRDYPEYNEDVIPGPNGPQRATKLTNGEKRLLDENLQIQLDVDPAEYFYHAHQPPVHSTGAIYARFLPRGNRTPPEDWTQFRVTGLPHYYERITHRNELWASAELPPIRPLDLKAVPHDDTAGRFEGIEFRVTDYLPYGELQQRWVDGGEFNPMISFRLDGGHGDTEMELFALHPRPEDRLSPEVRAEFRYAASAAEREQLLKQPEPRLVVRVPGANFEKTIPVSELGDAKPTALEGTEYTLELRELLPEGVLGEGISSPALALVRVTRGDKTFHRIVSADNALDARDMDDKLQPLPAIADTEIELSYLDAMPQRLLLVAGSDSEAVDVVLSGLNGAWNRQTVRVGKSFNLVPQVGMTVDRVLRGAVSETRPRIVPPTQRQSQQGKAQSLVRVEISDGKGPVQSMWLPFHQYAFRDAERAQPGRFRYFPQRLRLADGSTMEVLYGRWRDRLPEPVALDKFVLKTYPGGDRPSDYVSMVRFKRDGKLWPADHSLEVRSNTPRQHGDFWYFQSMWDPGTQCHTVLGVGNRVGVHWMLAGVCISIFGMIYAFYIKPGIIRRRKQRALDEARRRGKLPAAQPVPQREPELTSTGI